MASTTTLPAGCASSWNSKSGRGDVRCVSRMTSGWLPSPLAVQDIVSTLAGAGFEPENVMICLKETTWENWSFGGGRLIHT